MFLSSLTLFVALCLSAIAAFYSIAGLAAIFAAAVMPIVIMGSTLELAKITVTVWLHEYWSRCRWLMKAYLVIAVMVLMMITSMGIFGYLSKAHLDQAVPTGDVAAQVSLMDEKIRSERDNIEVNKQALKQLDAQVNEMLGRTTDDKGANRAVQIRRQQASERKQLQEAIAKSQNNITQLQNERAPLASNLRKVEAEVGPIKYIAALIYDQKPNEDMLERAVRWVIISIVFVFDPLAIMMLLAATESFGWHKRDRQKEKPQEEKIEPVVTPVGSTVPIPGPTVMPTVPETIAITPEPVPTIEPTIEPIVSASEPAPTAIAEPSGVEEPVVDDGIDQTKVAERAWKVTNPDGSLKKERELFEQNKISRLPWNNLAVILDPSMKQPGRMVGYGTAFPKDPNKGDQFVRTDRIPSNLFKFNGRDWIEIGKDFSDEYSHDAAYIDYLIAKLGSGEYDADMLTAAEEEQIALRLGNTDSQSKSTS